MMEEKKVVLLKKRTYLAMLSNSAGTKMFKNLWAWPMNDLLEDGKKSCAVFVSSVLFLFGHVKSKRATVASLEQDLVASGWRKADFPMPGDVLVWEPRMQNGHRNRHVGFYLGDRRAVSNNWKTGSVGTHHFTYGEKKNGKPVREIEAVYTHSFLVD